MNHFYNTTLSIHALLFATNDALRQDAAALNSPSSIKMAEKAQKETYQRQNKKDQDRMFVTNKSHQHVKKSHSQTVHQPAARGCRRRG